MDEFEHEATAADWEWWESDPTSPGWELVDVAEAGIDATVPGPPDEDEVKDILLREGIAPKREWLDEGCR
jgi:hypothetical protein